MPDFSAIAGGPAGWTRVKTGAKYAGVSERTFRDWLRQGLRHSRMPTGTILVRFQAIDDFLDAYSAAENQVDQIVNEVCAGLEMNH